LYRFLISGKVQGVYYRKYTSENLKKIGIRGYIRNLDDGRVEVVADTQNIAIDTILEILKQGSPFSRVDSIDIEEIESSEEFDSFEIRYR